MLLLDLRRACNGPRRLRRRPSRSICFLCWLRMSRAASTAAKFQLQREGYAAAISDPRVLDAIRSGRNGRVGVTFVEWSGIGSQRVVIDWTAVSRRRVGQRIWRSPAGSAAIVR
jgi:hypothetical protein